MPRRRSREAKSPPPLLARLIEAAKYAGEDAEGAGISGAPDALRAFGDLALWALPIHGVFMPNNNDVSLIVQRVAKAHLGLGEAKRECRRGPQGGQDFPRRDAIESANNHAQSVYDEAYFYAGPSFGITLANLAEPRRLGLPTLERHLVLRLGVMMIKAHVTDSRLIVDEPTDLPEGTEVELLPLDPGDWLDDAAREALHAALRQVRSR